MHFTSSNPPGAIVLSTPQESTEHQRQRHQLQRHQLAATRGPRRSASSPYSPSPNISKALYTRLIALPTAPAAWHTTDTHACAHEASTSATQLPLYASSVCCTPPYCTSLPLLPADQRTNGKHEPMRQQRIKISPLVARYGLVAEAFTGSCPAAPSACASRPHRPPPTPGR